MEVESGHAIPTFLWAHWGCYSSSSLASLDLSNLAGFENLLPSVTIHRIWMVSGFVVEASCHDLCFGITRRQHGCFLHPLSGGPMRAWAHSNTGMYLRCSTESDPGCSKCTPPRMEKSWAYISSIYLWRIVFLLTRTFMLYFLHWRSSFSYLIFLKLGVLWITYTFNVAFLFFSSWEML